MRINYYRPYKTKKLRSVIKTAFKILAAIFVIIIIGVIGVLAYFTKDLPDPAKISERKIVQSTKIYDRTGETLLYDIHGEEKRTVIAFDEMPQNVKDATVVTEDDNFYKHEGFDIKGIMRAFWVDIKNRQIRQGGSTITQQLIKHAILTPERTFTRKIKELILAFELEKKYSKNEILNFYLNQVPYGSNAYGIEAAAMTFFNKKANELTLAESTILAALPKAPTYYSPYGNNQKELKDRQLYILGRMYNQGYITENEFQEAKNKELNFSQEYRGIKAPHFVMYIQSYLADKYGEDAIEQNGLKVITTLDWSMQQKAEKIIKERGEMNEKKYNAKNAALTAINPNTGEILSMVGSRDYFNLKNDGNVNVTIRPRQPGSSFKPFAYAKALEKGFTPDTLIFDLKTEFNSNCPPDAEQEKDKFGLKCYHPQNYDLRFRGPVKIKEALAQSLNIPSVKVLYLAGIEDTIDLAQKMGITTLIDRKRYGLSLVLGGGEVTLLEETSAYGIFAAEGNKHRPTAILKIENGKGEILEEFQKDKLPINQILDPEIARQITAVLADNALRAPIFGENNYLDLGDIPAAAKTGTTQEYRDAWTIGYTPAVVVGVWVGNNDNSEMRKADGSAVAAPIWNNFMKEILKDQETRTFNAPRAVTVAKPVLNGGFGGKIYKIDKISGKLATEWTPPNLIEEKIYAEAHNILYYADPGDPRGNQPENPENNPQFINWEFPVTKWQKQSYCFKEKISIEGTGNFNTKEKCVDFSAEPPAEYDDIHTLENRPQITAIAPQDQTIYAKGNVVKIQIETQGRYAISQADFFVDNEFIGSDTINPYSLNFTIPNDTIKNQYIIEVKIYDIMGNSNNAKITINAQ